MRRLTAKQQAFCLAYIETGNASAAYRRAYVTSRMKSQTIHCAAWRLLHTAKVAKAIAGLQKSHRRRHGVTVDALTTELDEARLLAIEKGQSAAAVSATMAKAKLHGLPLARPEGKLAPLDELSDEELDAYIAELEREVREACGRGKGRDNDGNGK